MNSASDRCLANLATILHHGLVCDARDIYRRYGIISGLTVFRTWCKKLSKTKLKREILNPAVKGTLSHSILNAKVGAIPRVKTTDLRPGDRVFVIVRATREKIAGNIVSVVGQGQNKRFRINVVGGDQPTHRELLIAECQITKIGRSGSKETAFGFLKGRDAKPSVRAGRISRTTPRGKKK